MKKILAFLALSFGLALPAQAQYDKNQVMWENTKWNFYRSAHFDYYVAMDISSEAIKPSFERLVSHAEKTYENLSVAQQHELQRRPIVIVTRTHSQFEGSVRLHGDPFMPEGVGAFAVPRGSLKSDLLLVIKLDFLPSLNDTIVTHELEHIFQFDMVGANFFQRLTGLGFPDGWLFEAVADYMANKYAPYTRDDIRRTGQRIAAANATNPNADFPTLLSLKAGLSDPYGMGALVFMYLEEQFGEAAVHQLIVDVFKNRKQGFESLLADMSEGMFSTPELFDRAHRDYWSAKYSEDSRKRAQPYSKTSNYQLRQLIKIPYPYQMLSKDLSPSVKGISAITVSPKNGIVIATMPALPREDPPYIKPERRKKYRLFGADIPVKDPGKVMKILTKKMPPRPYEGITIQSWTRDGSETDWWQETAWLLEVKSAEEKIEDLDKEMTELRKEKDSRNALQVADARKKLLQEELKKLYERKNVSLIAFFAKRNRDHDLFIYDVNKGKLVKHIEIPYDRAISPAFSPDGKKIYFSASKMLNRKIYSVELESGRFEQVTFTGDYHTAPAISPDGTKLAYIGLVGDYQKLFLQDLGDKNPAGGSVRQLTFGRWNDNSPDWSGDGTKLVFTSDEKDIIWNLYTLDLETDIVRQWTDLYGGVFTPKFMPGENDRVVYTAMFEQDQFLIYVYPNFDLFDARLHKPLREFTPQDTGVSMDYAVRHEETTGGRLDERQLEDPENPPARWKLYGRQVSISQNTYWGTSVYSRMLLQDILANRTHSALFAQAGELRIYDYTYVDQSRRWAFAGNVGYSKYPLHYFLRNFQGERPRYPSPNDDQNIFTLTGVWSVEKSALLYAQYPFTKWDRIELGLRGRSRDFLLPYSVSPENREEFVKTVPPEDVRLYDFFTASSNQTTVGGFGAFVHDTVISTYNTLGPLHGTALRAQVEAGAGLTEGSSGYVSGMLDLKRYQRITSGSLIAVRLTGLASSRPTGDFVLLDNDMLPGYPYSSVFGNQLLYGAAQLRFPVASMNVFDTIGVKIRGSAFGNYAIARFSQDGFPASREWSYGFGVHAYVGLPLNFIFARTRFEPKKFNFSFNIGFGF